MPHYTLTHPSASATREMMEHAVSQHGKIRAYNYEPARLYIETDTAIIDSFKKSHPSWIVIEEIKLDPRDIRLFQLKILPRSVPPANANGAATVSANMTEPVPSEKDDKATAPDPIAEPKPEQKPFAIKKLTEMNPDELDVQRRSYLGSSSIAAIIGTAGTTGAVISVTHDQPGVAAKIVHAETGIAIGLSAVFFMVAAYHLHLLRRTKYEIEIRKNQPELKPGSPE